MIAVLLIQKKLCNKATFCLLKRATRGTNYGKIMQISEQGQADTCRCQYKQYGQLRHMQEE